MDAITRESHLRVLRELRRGLRYMSIDLIYQQALIGKAGLDDLSDDGILALHKSIDAARDCYHNGGGSFEEAGLIRSLEQNWGRI